jgi:hypothetical protein
MAISEDKLDKWFANLSFLQKLDVYNKYDLEDWYIISAKGKENIYKENNSKSQNQESKGTKDDKRES